MFYIKSLRPAEEKLLKGHANLRQIFGQEIEINKAVEKDGKTKLDTKSGALYRLSIFPMCIFLPVRFHRGQTYFVKSFLLQLRKTLYTL